MPKTWFITGTSTGFGRSMTEQLLKRGDRVFATLRKPEMLADLRGRYGQALAIEALDVTDTAAIRQVVDQAFKTFGRIDVVVSNAGYGLFGAAEELTDEQIRRQIDTNVIGSIQLVRAVLPHLRAQGQGRILQLSSMGGQIAFPGLSLYHTTKWAIEGFFEALVQEITPFGIEATLVEPGGARTMFGRDSMAIAPALDIYATAPFSGRRKILAEGSHNPIGDPEKMVLKMIESADISPAPLRLTLGSDAYRLMHAALTKRLEQLVSQEPLARSTDADS